MKRFGRMMLAASERWHEWRLGVRTSGVVPVPPDLDAPGRLEYAPVAYRHLLAMLPRLPAAGHVLLDYGCGMGRVLVTAARRPYRAVLGVELVPQLAAAARENLRRARGLRCPDVRVIEADATSFSLPDEVTVLHFFNPFHGDVLDAVLRKVRESLDRRPRTIHALYFNRDDFARAAAGLSWVHTLEESRRRNPPLSWGLYEMRG
jgi:SAM-dependent methyltransferase